MSSHGDIMAELDNEAHLFLPEVSPESVKLTVMTRRLWALGLVSTALAGALVGSAVVRSSMTQAVDQDGFVAYTTAVAQKDAPVCSGRSHFEVVSVASLWSPPADKDKTSITADFVTKGIWHARTSTSSQALKPDTYFRIKPVMGFTNIRSLSLNGRFIELAMQAGKAASMEMSMTDLNEKVWTRKDKTHDLSLTFLDLDVHGANAEFVCIEGEIAFEASLTPSSKIIETTHGKGTCFQATDTGSKSDNPTEPGALSLAQLDRSVTITFTEYDVTKPIKVRIGSSGQSSDETPRILLSAMPILKCPMANPSGITTFRDSEKELADTIHKLIKRVVSDESASAHAVKTCQDDFNTAYAGAPDKNKKCEAAKAFQKCVAQDCDSNAVVHAFAANKKKLSADSVDCGDIHRCSTAAETAVQTCQAAMTKKLDGKSGATAKDEACDAADTFKACVSKTPETCTAAAEAFKANKQKYDAETTWLCDSDVHKC